MRKTLGCALSILLAISPGSGMSGEQPPLSLLASEAYLELLEKAPDLKLTAAEYETPFATSKSKRISSYNIPGTVDSLRGASLQRASAIVEEKQRKDANRPQRYN